MRVLFYCGFLQLRRRCYCRRSTPKTGARTPLSPLIHPIVRFVSAFDVHAGDRAECRVLEEPIETRYDFLELLQFTRLIQLESEAHRWGSVRCDAARDHDHSANRKLICIYSYAMPTSTGRAFLAFCHSHIPCNPRQYFMLSFFRRLRCILTSNWYPPLWVFCGSGFLGRNEWI
ncbi:hypothetical protein BDN72DRAFT_66866 [Pluteus cervinus]|uniref:Uncharacterized protein n=1 Tax=Pluteus cervinus TaxID=181527 RepID=A0ACD3AQG8_9AGAR|nr:hypothetical protein BDN72DRAFT_66866 [Pluteus cervinus]